MLLSEDVRSRMGTIDPLLAEVAKKSPGPPSDGDFFQRRQARAEHLAQLRHLYPIPGPIPEAVTETSGVIEARDGYQIPIKTYRPVSKPAKPSPVIIMMHEGGWSMGDLTDEDLNCRMLARDLNALCINIDYRLAPEHAWPKCVDDCWDVVQSVAHTASPDHPTFPGDPTAGLIVGGASAGGNLAAVMAQLSRDTRLHPPITGQYLCVPALMWQDVVPEKWRADYRSRFEGTVDPILGELAKAGRSSENLAGKGSTDPLFNPLLHPNLRDLPPAYLQVAGLDPLRDEALIYEHVLREENGVQTKMDVYDGYGHMFWTNWPLLERSKEFVADTLKGFTWLLDASKSRPE